MPSARGTRQPGLCREPHTPRFTPSPGRGLLLLLNQLGREVRGGPLTCPRPQPAEMTARGLVPGRLHFLHRLSGIRVRLGEPIAVRDSLATRGDRPFLCGAPTPPSKPIFAPSLVLALCRQVSPHRQPQWLTPSHARVQDEGARSGRFPKVLWFVSSPSLCLFLRAEVIFIFCLIYYFMLINFKKIEELG